MIENVFITLIWYLFNKITKKAEVSMSDLYSAVLDAKQKSYKMVLWRNG